MPAFRIALQALSIITCVTLYPTLTWGFGALVIAVTEAWTEGVVLASAVLLETLVALALTIRLTGAIGRLEKPFPPRCAACGYDLRLLASRRCPECGHPVPRMGAA
jgi:rRNA maturation endonuclease Nob1